MTSVRLLLSHQLLVPSAYRSHPSSNPITSTPLDLYPKHTMVRQQLLQRASALTTRNALQPSLLNTAQRRFASGEMPKLTGAADNAFNRERMAVKQHAAGSSGAYRHNLTNAKSPN